MRTRRCARVAPLPPLPSHSGLARRLEVGASHPKGTRDGTRGIKRDVRLPESCDVDGNHMRHLPPELGAYDIDWQHVDVTAIEEVVHPGADRARRAFRQDRSKPELDVSAAAAAALPATARHESCGIFSSSRVLFGPTAGFCFPEASVLTSHIGGMKPMSVMDART